MNKTINHLIYQSANDLRSADRIADGVEKSSFVSQEDLVASRLTSLLRAVCSHCVQEILHRAPHNVQVHAKRCTRRRSATRDPAQCSSKHSCPRQALHKEKCYKRSCTVFFKTFTSTPSAAQGEEVLQEILRSVLQNIHIHATKSKLKQCRQVSALSSKPHLL